MTTTTNPLTDRTNVTPTSYDYNGTTYTKQARTDANGNAYTVDIANTPAPAPAVTAPTGTTPTTGATPSGAVTTPQTIGSVYGIDPNKASSDYASYLANPDQYLSNQGISVGDLKSKALAELQSSIDATNAYYGNKLNQAKQQGAGILGQTGAIQARRGLLGSDFGAAQTDSINNSNNEIYNSIEAEKAAKIADLMSGAQSKAEQRYAEKRAAIEGGLKSQIEYLKGQEAASKVAATDAAQMFIAQGSDPSILDKSYLDKYAKDHGTTPDAIKNAFMISTYNTKQAKIKADQELANKLAEKGVENIGEGQSGYRYNPATKQYELVAKVAKTYAPKYGSTTSTTGIDGSFPPDIQAAAQSILDGKSKLNEYPSAKRIQINAALMQTHTQTGGLAQNAYDAITNMESHPGMSGAIGTNLLLGFGKNMAGSDSAGFLKNLDMLKATIKLLNIKYLKGTGALSDAEGATLENAGTTLDPNQPEKDFTAELSRVKAALLKASSQDINQTKIPASSGIIYSPDGSQQVDTSTLTPAELKEANAAGWK